MDWVFDCIEEIIIVVLFKLVGVVVVIGVVIGLVVVLVGGSSWCDVNE